MHTWIKNVQALKSVLVHQSIETPTFPLPHYPWTRVGDSKGMDALLNTSVAQGGGVIDNYLT